MKIRPADSTQWYADNGDATLRLDYDLNEDSIVFDIGGSVGDWCTPIYNRYKCTMHVFEPTALFNSCRARLSDQEKVHMHNVAAWTFNGKLTLGVDDNEASIYHEDNLMEIDCIDLKSFIKDLNINNIDLVKINIEGAEYPLLRDLIDNGTIDIFDNLQVQFHMIDNYEEEYRYVLEGLSKTHSITWKYPYIWENWKRNVNA
jgi:FkbM family methyltransferase